MNYMDQVDRGWDAYGSDGQKIGSIYDRGDNYLVVEKGLFFPKDIYVPADAIERADPNEQRVYLNVAKDDVESMGWTEPQGGTRTETDSDTWETRKAASSDTMRVPVHEESLRAEKQRTNTGEVEVNKRVTEREENLEVPVTRDEVQVRRVATDRPATDTDRAFAQDRDTIRVPVTEERVKVTKEPRVVEELEVSKRPVTETKKVSGTVRREEVDVRGADEQSGRRTRDRYEEPAGAMATKRTGYGDDDREHGSEAVGGGMGALGGAVVGGAVAGPPGALVGGAIGAAGGAMAGEAAEGGDDEPGSGAGGAAGGVAGAAIGGAVAGPPGAIVGGAVGAGAGAGAGDKAEEATEDEADDR